MTTIFCYVDPHPKALAAVQRFAPDAELIDVSGDDFAYWRVIKNRWTGDEDLITIEQDNEVTEEAMLSFEFCPEPWCVYAYKPAGVFEVIFTESLGCTKFSKELQEAVPILEIGSWSLTVDPGKKVVSDPDLVRWDRIDYRISTHLKAHGFRPHVHGFINHYHAYPLASANEEVDQAVQGFMHVCRLDAPTETRYAWLRKVERAQRDANFGEFNVIANRAS